jgi:hypothetical protein
MHRAHFGCELCSFAVECDSGAASRLAAHFNVAPRDSMIPASADGLHGGFLGGEARCIAFDPVGLRFTVPDLSLGKDSVQKAVAEACNRRFDARYLRYVDPSADNHADSVMLGPTRRNPSDAPIVRPPILDGLFDISRREIRRQCAFDQPCHFFVRGKAECDELTLAELSDLWAQGIRHQHCEPLSLFESYDAILYFQSVLSEPGDGDD